MTCIPRLSSLLPNRSDAIDNILDSSVTVLEASKDYVSSVALIPGLSAILNLVVEILKKVQVRAIHLSESIRLFN